MLLALIFLFGFVASYPYGTPKEASDEALLAFMVDTEKAMHQVPYADEGDDDDDGPQTELGKHLQKKLGEFLDKIKDAMDRKEALKQEWLDKVKELTEKLKDLKESLGKKMKEKFEDFKEKTKNWLKDLIDKLTGKDEEYSYVEFDEDEEIETELGKHLKEQLDRLLEKIKEKIDAGKVVKDNLLEELKQIREKLKDVKEDIGDKAREVLERIKEKIKDKAKSIWEKLKEIFGRKDTSDDSDEQFYLALDEEESEDDNQLRNRLADILGKIKEALEKGKLISKEWIEKAIEIKNKLKKKGADYGEKVKELFQKIKEKLGKWFDKFLEKLGLKDTDSVAYSESSVKAVLRGIIEKIDAGESENDIGQYIREQLGNTPLGENLLGLLQNGGKSPVRQVCKALLGLTGRDSRAIKDLFDKLVDYLKELRKDLKEKYSKFLEWVKENVNKGKEAAKDKMTNIKEAAKEFIKRAKELNKEVIEEAVDFFQNFKEDLGSMWDEITVAAREAIGH